MQVRVDWVLIIFGTQVIKKKPLVLPVFPEYLSVSYDYIITIFFHNYKLHHQTWLLKWGQIQSLLVYVFSLILFVFTFGQFICYLHSVNLHVLSLILFIISQVIYIQSHLICIQSHLIYIQSHLIYVDSQLVCIQPDLFMGSCYHPVNLYTFSQLIYIPYTCVVRHVENLIKICSFPKKN